MEWDFIANAAVDALEVVPEAYRGYYEENKAEGKFLVKADIRPLTDALTNSNKKLADFNKRKKDDNSKDAARRTIIDTITTKLTESGVEVGEDMALLPDIIANTLSDLTDKVKGGKEAKLNMEALKKDFDKRVGVEKTKFEGEMNTMRSTLEKYLIKGAAATALSSAGTVEKGADLLMPHILRAAKVIKNDDGEYDVRVVDEDNNIRANLKGEPMSVADLVAEMKQTFPTAFKSESRSGSGTPPGKGKSTPGNQQQRQASLGGGEKSSTQKISAGLDALRR